MLAVEWGTGQVLWSILWVALVALWIYLIIVVLSDLMRARDMSGWAKAGWTVFVIVLPYLGVIAYLVLNGDAMAERRLAAESAAGAAVLAHGTETATGEPGGPAHQLEKLAALHDAGAIDDAEFARRKTEVIGS